MQVHVKTNTIYNSIFIHVLYDILYKKEIMFEISTTSTNAEAKCDVISEKHFHYGINEVLYLIFVNESNINCPDIYMYL